MSKFSSFHHCRFIVGNAAQAATFYVARMGFERVAYRGLETGCRDVVSHVVKHGDILFCLTSPLNPDNHELGDFLVKHGDGVKDVALTVDDCRAVFDSAKANGAVVVKEPWEETDQFGTVVMATIQTYGDTVHTFVEHKDYNGPFLPGFVAVEEDDPLYKITAPAEYYEKILGFHQFWSVDDSVIHTEYSSLRSIVMADPSDKVKMPINEPANGKRKSQI